ncbi:MAG: crossover junction endodeoxyribonuclease RuvC [Bacteroidales bacterium]|nr:crossover junction endodeoxyribonuclease RuvC [Bacteroidales bacterium]
MTILGIDPGTLILGYSILQTEPTPSVVAMDVLYMKKIDDYNERIRTIFYSINDIITSHHPDHLSIEAPFFGKNVQSMLKLGRAQGVSIAAALAHNIPFTEYEPATIKQYITGYGNASKEQVRSMLEAHLGIELHPHYLDATDALAAAYCHHLATSNPLSDLRATLKPARRKNKKQSWADFVNNNPDAVNE